jgi:indolepyruvate ferredoxin oxidoreductase beta subunit
MMDKPFDFMLTGVGGEGVLTAATFIAQAAQLEGHYVRGVQLHGLAQRGGSIPTFVRFGPEGKLDSPGIMQANADLIMAFEPLEAVRAVYYARKQKTTFVINTYPYMPIYANLLDMPYPTMAEIFKRIMPFSKKTYVFKSHEVAKEKFGNAIYGNTILTGVAVGLGVLPLKEKSLREIIKTKARHGVEENLAALKLGVKEGKTM